VSLRWKLNRLSAMDGGEISYRARQRLRASLERLGVMTAARVPPPAPTQKGGTAWTSPLPTRFDAHKYASAADRILAGDFDVFALRPARLGFPPQWNRDPKTGRSAPLTFGKSLDYRDERLVGDIKYLWEPSRHAELVTLAQAWHLTRDPRYLAGCRTLVDSWIEQCPYLRGPHWTSSLEHAMRLINWSFAWHLLGGDESPLFAGAEGAAFRQRWLACVFQHCHFISGHFSRHSSANNHLLGELIGLFVAAVTWPFWRQSRDWAEAAQREIEEQALEQNGPDGVNREQATWYHHEVADMLVVAGLVGRANGREFSEAYSRRVESMLDFIASVMDFAGNVPAIGDADDAIIARLDPAPDSDVYHSLLAAGVVLFSRPDLRLKAARFHDKSRWLLGDQAAARFEAHDSPAVPFTPRRQFTDAGYYVLGHGFETPREIRIIADAGPLGYLSIAAHGHADALSLTLSVSGVPLLIDPGTFAYHTQRQWRDYFRGTAAHNTVRVDRVDQSTSGGNFLWLSHAQSRVLSFRAAADYDQLIAEHEGYRRLTDPVVHRRELRLDHASGKLLVVDELLCDGEHDVEVFWHFAPGCDVQRNGRQLRVTRAGVQLDMTLPGATEYELISGRETPPLGWASPRFDHRVPSPTVVAAAKIRGNTRLATELSISTSNPFSGLSS
jgi:hypothetical protein